MTTLYTADVVSVGDDAQEMFDGGIVIFFAQPCPEALADVSVVHTGSGAPVRDPRVGDVLRLADDEVTITAVGELAAENLRLLGHVVVYLDPAPDQTLLPGAIFASGRLTRPEAGARLELVGEA